MEKEEGTVHSIFHISSHVCHAAKQNRLTNYLVPFIEKEESDEDMGFGLFD